ncbi:MAG: DUF4392 domain-containing protein [Desulfobacterota bacterium]|nr:DUF4392 domain-containing protein [Thermodesulfobacteriota bacterium]
MEEVINFPGSLLPPRDHRWQNLPMAPYSDLLGAVTSLTAHGRKAMIVTGFYIPAGDPPATETDGPPGALILAEGLRELGMEVSLLSDEYTLPALSAGLTLLGLSNGEIPLVCFPIEHCEAKEDSSLSRRFVEELFHGPLAEDLSHLIFIERVGPNHTLESFLAQRREGSPPLKEFQSILPPSLRNRCFNSRLEDITRFTAKTHLLLEFQKNHRLPLVTIGIGDRGNEIGAGKIPWEVFYHHSTTYREPVFCSRIETDHFISCGVSNWGGYALMAGVALARGRLDLIEKITSEKEGEVLSHLIHHGPAVDGLTCRQDHSVDGIEFKDYMKVVERLKAIALE